MHVWCRLCCLLSVPGFFCEKLTRSLPWLALSVFRTAVARIRQIARDVFSSWDMFDVDECIENMAYVGGPVLPPANGFLLLGDGEQDAQEAKAKTDSLPRSRLVPETLPAELAGLPVFEVDGEHIVFVAHVLTRVLECQCRANRHFGLFKDKKHVSFRRMVDTSNWRYDTHFSDSYKQHRERYSLLRVKDQSAAITLEGLLKWHSGKMAVFVRKEANKCKQGCVEGKCTCPK